MYSGAHNKCAHNRQLMLIFEIKFSWISINFVKSYIHVIFVSNIRRQNGFAFHMYANISSYRMSSPANYLVDLIYTAIAIGVLKISHKQLLIN